MLTKSSVDSNAHLGLRTTKYRFTLIQVHVMYKRSRIIISLNMVLIGGRNNVGEKVATALSIRK
jgi:hypothetical protein